MRSWWNIGWISRRCRQWTSSSLVTAIPEQQLRGGSSVLWNERCSATTTVHQIGWLSR
jgi:hypothetical protein